MSINGCKKKKELISCMKKLEYKMYNNNNNYKNNSDTNNNNNNNK